jgi:hypothetical protein
MKETVFIGLLIIVLAIGFVGCDDDGEGIPGSLNVIGLPSNLSINFIQVSSVGNPIEPPSHNQDCQFNIHTIAIGFQPNPTELWSATNKWTFFESAGTYAWSTSSDRKTFNSSGLFSIQIVLHDNGEPIPGGLLLRNIPFQNGNATINWAEHGFQLPPTNGKITLSNIPTNLQNRYVLMVGTMDASTALYGLGGAVSVTGFTGVRIEGSSIELPIHQISLASPTQFTAFSGSGTAMSVMFIFLNTPEFNFTTFNPMDPTGFQVLSFVNIPSFSEGIVFSNGQGTANFTQGQQIGFD